MKYLNWVFQPDSPVSALWKGAVQWLQTTGSKKHSQILTQQEPGDKLLFVSLVKRDKHDKTQEKHRGETVNSLCNHLPIFTNRECFTTMRRLQIKYPSGNCQQIWFKPFQTCWKCWQVGHQQYKCVIQRYQKLNVAVTNSCRKYIYPDIGIIILRIASLRMLKWDTFSHGSP